MDEVRAARIDAIASILAFCRRCAITRRLAEEALAALGRGESTVAWTTMQRAQDEVGRRDSDGERDAWGAVGALGALVAAEDKAAE